MIKQALKKTWAYEKYNIVRMTYNKTGNMSPFAFINLKPIRGLSEKSVSNALKKVAYDSCGGSFSYWIDESVLLSDRYRAIGNMPVDYAYVINTPFETLTEKYPALKTGIENYIKKNSLKLPSTPAKNLKDALQIILFWNQLLWQTGHRLNGLGRLDKVLDAFPINNDSKELIAQFLQTLHNHYQYKSNVLYGDTGQIILLGGNEEDGSYFCNDYTYLFIECIKELSLPDPKLLLRVGKDTPKDLLDKATECIATGVGSPLLSNDEVIVPYLIDFGYDKHDAFNYGVSACWEPLSIGNSLEQNNIGCLNFGMAVHKTIMDETFTQAVDISAIKALLFKYVAEDTKNVLKQIDRIDWAGDALLSMLFGLDTDISLGGAKYNNYGILSVGMASLVNSVLNIQKYVFEEKKYTLDEVQSIIAHNYCGYEADQELFADNKAYGTENSGAIQLTNEIIKYAEKCVFDYKNKYGGRVKFGLSSPSYLTLGKETWTTLDGRKAGIPFAIHISNDSISSPTEIINFASKLEFSGLSCNANVIDIMVTPSLINDNKEKFVQLIKGAIDSGFFQMQFNVLSYSQLVDAKVHPENYPNLIVRVWGFSAYFNDLPDEYKDMLINRAKEMEHIE